MNTQIPNEGFYPLLNYTGSNTVLNVSVLETPLLALYNSSLIISGNLTAEEIQIESSNLTVEGTLTINSALVIRSISSPLITLSQCISGNGTITIELNSLPQSSAEYTLINYNCSTVPNISVYFNSSENNCVSVSPLYTTKTLSIIVFNMCDSRSEDINVIIMAVVIPIAVITIVVILVYYFCRQRYIKSTIKQLRMGQAQQ